MTPIVAITGAAGRIGRLLCQRLSNLGHPVRALDIVDDPGDLPEYRRADIRDLSRMEEVLTGARAVIHLAATPNAAPGWAKVMELNIAGTRNVLEAARRQGVRRVVFASSIHTVGALPADTPLTPDLAPRPSGIYGASKIAGEALCDVYAAKGGLRCFSARVCSFRPEPQDARELTTWLGREDCIHLFDRCVMADLAGHHWLWGVSANTRLAIDDPVARDIG